MFCVLNSILPTSSEILEDGFRGGGVKVCVKKLVSRPIFHRYKEISTSLFKYFDYSINIDFIC